MLCLSLEYLQIFDGVLAFIFAIVKRNKEKNSLNLLKMGS